MLRRRIAAEEIAPVVAEFKCPPARILQQAALLCERLQQLLELFLGRLRIGGVARVAAVQVGSRWRFHRQRHFAGVFSTVPGRHDHHVG